ncbi:MAG TPA: YadA-like family protein [Lysobacter sp.]
MDHLTNCSSFAAAARSGHRRSVMAACIALALAAVPAYAQKTQLGTQADAAGPDSTAIGAHTTSDGDGSVAVGIYATTSADRAIAIGRYAAARALDALALGAGAVVESTAPGSVALGAGSRATGASLATSAYLTGTMATSELAIGGRRITGVADGANNNDAATVGQLKAANVGNDLAVRYVWNDANSNKIVDAGEIDYSRVIMGGDPKTGVPIAGGVKVSNVMAGAVVANGMEAVNGGQLHAISKSVADALGGTSSVDANGRVSAGLSVDGTTYGTVASALDAVNLTANKGWYLQSNGTTGKIAPGATLDVLNGTNTTAAYDAAARALTVGVVDAPVFAGMVTANGGMTLGSGKTVDMGGNAITKVADGTALTDAATVGQVNTRVGVLGASVASALGGTSSYDPASNDVVAGLSVDGTTYDSVNDALDALNITANKGWNVAAGGSTGNIGPDDTLTMADGSNTVASYDPASRQLTVGVVSAPTFSGMVTFGGGLTVAGGQTVNMGGNVIAGVARGKASTDAVNKEQLDEIEAAAGLGWNLQVEGGVADKIGGGETITVASGANASVTHDVDNNRLQVGVVDAPVFAGMVTANGGLTVAGGTVVDVGGNVVTNVGAGTVDAASTMAVNGSQLFGVSQSFANALGGGATVASDGSMTAPQYALANANAIAGTTGPATNVGTGFDTVDQALGVLNTAIGDITTGSAGIRYFHVNSTDADSSAAGDNAIGIGPKAKASGGMSIAAGYDAQAVNTYATAFGTGAWAYGYESTAVGAYAEARGNHSAAFGSALAFGEGTTALGTWAYAGGGFDWTGEGGRPGNIVEIVNGTAVGFSSVAAADNATALGAEAEARGTGSVALGSTANVTAANAVAIGTGAHASVADSVALGSAATTSAAVGTAGITINGIRHDFAGAAPVGTVSVGSAGAERTLTNVAAGRLESGSTDGVNGSQLYATNQAIEAIGSVAGNANDLAVKYLWTDPNSDGVATPDEIDHGTVVLAGAQGTRIGNLAPGLVLSGSMDAVNGGQLFAAMNQVATYLGGGATMTAQGLSAPGYLIQGATYNNVGDALQALDVSVTLLNGKPYGSQLAGYTHGQSPGGGYTRGDGGPGSTALGVEAHASGVEDAVAIGEHASVAADYGTAVGQGASATADNAVALGHDSVADRANTVSVGSAGNERQVANVADATQGTDAINKRQLDRGVASANGYTDARVNALSDSFELFQGNVDQRFRKQDQRIDRQGAMSAAMMNMAVSAAGIHTPNRVGVGIGFQGGEAALSLGYQRAFSDRATLTFGGAFSDDDSAVGIGAGFGW